jgi:hypothetical protein
MPIISLTPREVEMIDEALSERHRELDDKMREGSMGLHYSAEDMANMQTEKTELMPLIRRFANLV